MKRLKLFALGLMGASAMMFTSCAEDEPVDPLKPKPTLEITVAGNSQVLATNDDVTVDAGTALEFYINAIKAGGGSDLESFQVTTSLVNNLQLSALGYNFNSGAVNLQNGDEEQYVDTLSVDGVFLSNEGDYTFQFKLTDKDGQERTVDIIVTVTKATQLSDETIGAFFHIAGTLEGAYNLVDKGPTAGTGASADPAKQDMKNTDAAGDPFTGSWTAGNATLFVQDNSFDYDNATDEAAAASYTAGTAGANVNDPDVGDIYIAKLRGTSEYAVIQITEIDPNNTSGGAGNPGKITFNFKMKP